MSNHAWSCCCGSPTCEDFNACPNNAQTVTFPSMVFERAQRQHSSAGLLYEATLTMTIRDAVFYKFPDDPTPCWYLQSASVDVEMSAKTWTIFTGTIDATASGARCPDCLERCLTAEETFSATDYAISECMTICCVQPCLPDDPTAVIRMQMDCPIEGEFESCTYDTDAFAKGQCVQTCDPAYTTSLYFGFNAYTPSQCLGPEAFRCRAVDWAVFDGSPFFYQGGFWPVGRIPGTTGGDPRNQICEGAYQYERPDCVEDGEAFRLVLACAGAKSPWGTEIVHHDVTSCELTDPLGPAGINLCKELICIDGTKTANSQCCERFIKACMCVSNCAQPWTCGLPVQTCSSPNPFCNTDGLLDFIYRTDRSSSTWAQPTIP